MVCFARDWRRGNCRTAVGQCCVLSALWDDGLLSVFANKASVAIVRYKQFFTEDKNQPSPFENFRNQVFLGHNELVAQIHIRIDLDLDKGLGDCPSMQRRSLTNFLAKFERLIKHKTQH